jgi:pimeloyl-ACP methyl ester carboxylesterase
MPLPEGFARCTGAACAPTASGWTPGYLARAFVRLSGRYRTLRVIGRLQLVGLKVTAVQNPLNLLADDVAATRRILALQDGPTVLVGRSWAGAAISDAGVDPKVSALVYVAARVPYAGDDYTALAAKFSTPPANAGLVKPASSPN